MARYRITAARASASMCPTPITINSQKLGHRNEQTQWEFAVNLPKRRPRPPPCCRGWRPLPSCDDPQWWYIFIAHVSSIHKGKSYGWWQAGSGDEPHLWYTQLSANILIFKRQAILTHIEHWSEINIWKINPASDHAIIFQNHIRFELNQNDCIMFSENSSMRKVTQKLP